MAPESTQRSNTGIPANPPSYDALDLSKPISTNALRPRCKSLLSISEPNSPLISIENDAADRKISPYILSSELQEHTRKLGGASSASLSDATSESKMGYFDFLPSFQMFRSIFKKNDLEFDEPSLGHPPVYGDTTCSSASPPTLSIRTSAIDTERSTQSGTTESSGEINAMPEGQGLFDGVTGSQRRTQLMERHADGSEEGGRSFDAHIQTSSATAQEAQGYSVLDNIDKLPHSKSSPLSIEIFVTKDVPIPNKKNDLEIKLKEYSCGDRVNGYVVITNTLDKDVDFGLFTMTLEGTVKSIVHGPHPQTSKGRRVILKKFLKMYDLNASFNEFNIPSSAGVEYCPFDVDILDWCIMGLPQSRVLKANTRYKKFITFTFPEMLLDNACPHNLMRHNMPPPSFGIDGSCFNGRSESIEVNKTLGYGVLDSRGSPVKVRDYSFNDISVSYSLEAKIIDKIQELSQREPVFAHEINDPNNKSKYIVSASSQYFVRFVPDIRTQVNNYSKANSDFEHGTFGTVGIDGVLYNRLTSGFTWKAIKRMHLSIHLEIEAALDKYKCLDNVAKRKSKTFLKESCVAWRDVIPMDPVETNASTEGPDSDRSQHYHNLRMICNSPPVEIFVKKKKRILLTSVKLGEMTLYVKTPEKLIPYISPRLLQRYNNGSGCSLMPVSSKDGLQPVMSNMEGLYNRDHKSVISSVNLELVFDSLNDSNTRPPSILFIETNIIAWSYKTDYPIPISIDHDFFYTIPTEPNVIFREDDLSTSMRNQKKLMDTANHQIDFLKETKTTISHKTFSYLKGISLLRIKKHTIKDFFETNHSQSSPWLETRGEWVTQSTPCGSRWTRTLEVPAKIINKNNVALNPSFQSCLVGRLYALQVVVRFEGAETPANILKVEVPVLVG